MTAKSAKAVEVGEASESSDSESEGFVKVQRTPFGTSTDDCMSSFSTVTAPSVSATTASTVITPQEFPVNPVLCRGLVEHNLSLGRSIHEMATIPYAVALREIDNITLDLVKSQQMMDGVCTNLASVGSNLQQIQKEAEELRRTCRIMLPNRRPSPL